MKTKFSAFVAFAVVLLSMFSMPAFADREDPGQGTAAPENGGGKQ